MITCTHNLITAASSNQASLLWSPIAASQVALAQTGGFLNLPSNPLAPKACSLGLEETFEGQGYRHDEDTNYDYRTSGYFAPPIAFVDLYLGSCP
jgi:hypothetical protein